MTMITKEVIRDEARKVIEFLDSQFPDWTAQDYKELLEELANQLDSKIDELTEQGDRHG